MHESIVYEDITRDDSIDATRGARRPGIPKAGGDVHRPDDLGEREAERLHGWIHDGDRPRVRKLLCGGDREGAMMQPTLLEPTYLPRITDVVCQ